MAVAAILFLVLVFFIVAVTFLLNQAGVIAVSSVPESPGFESDEIEFKVAIQGKLQDSSSDNEIAAWIDEQLDQTSELDDTVEIPHDIKKFMNAVYSSPYAEGLGLMERTSLRMSLTEAFPYPDILAEHTLLSVEYADGDTNSEYVTANLFFYDDSSQAFSIRWFLHKDRSGWKLYDWQRMEYGRRTSDEWACYFSYLNASEAQGYDNAMLELGQIVTEYDDGEVTIEQATERVRQVLRRKVLQADESLRDLRAAWTYEAIGQYEESLKVLDQIDDPKMRWGVLATKAFTLHHLGRYDESISVGETLLAEVPDHPNAHEILGVALDELGRREESFEHYMKFLTLCPDSSLNFSRLLNAAGAEDFKHVMEVAVASDQLTSRLLAILSRRFHNTWADTRMFDEWSEPQADFPGVPESFWALLAASENLDVEADEALDLVLANLAKNQGDELSEFADQELASRYRMQKRYQELITHVGASTLIDESLASIYYDGYDITNQELLDELTRSTEGADAKWLDLLIASTEVYERPQSALQRVERFQRWAKEAPEEFEQSESAGYANDWSRSLWTTAMIQLDRADEVLRRFEYDDQSLHAVTDHFVSHPQYAGSSDIISAVGSIDRPIARRNGLQMIAAQKITEGDFDAADVALRQASKSLDEEIAGQSEDESYTSNWQLRTLIERRADYAVRSKTFRQIVPQLHSHADWYFERLVTRSERTGDVEGIKAAALACSTSSGDPLSPLTKMHVATSCLEIGYHDDAQINLVRDAIGQLQRDDEDEFSPYIAKNHLMRFLLLLVVSERLNEAIDILKLAQDSLDWISEEDAAEWANTVALAESDLETLMGNAESMTEQEFADWANGEFPRLTLTEASAIAEPLLAKFPAMTSPNFGGEDFYLFIKSPSKLGVDEIRRWLAATFGNDSVLTEVETANDASALIAQSRDGTRLLVSLLDPRFTFDDESDRETVQLLGDSSQLVLIESIGTDLSSIKRGLRRSVPFYDLRAAWRLAQTIATDSRETHETLGVYAYYSRIVLARQRTQVRLTRLERRIADHSSVVSNA